MSKYIRHAVYGPASIRPGLPYNLQILSGKGSIKEFNEWATERLGRDIEFQSMRFENNEFDKFYKELEYAKLFGASK